MKKTLITGVTGMVGSHLLDRIANNEFYGNIIGACRWRSPQNNIAHHFKSQDEKIKFVHLDLRDSLSIFNVIKEEGPFDYVFHLAAQSYPHVSFKSPIETLSTNIDGTFSLLDSLLKLCPKSKIHVCSSSEVFGRVPKEYLPINEKAPFHPASPYAISKVGTDLIGRYFNEAYNMKTFVTRMFTHTGPRRGDVFHESTFAKQIALIEKGLNKDKTIYVGNILSMRTYADVRDAVKAYDLLMKSPKTGHGETFNIGGNFSCKVEDTLKYLISISTMPDQIKFEIDKKRLRPIDADLQIPDNTKFKSYIDWVPEYSYEDTMNDLLNYWRNEISKNPELNSLIR